VFRQEHRSAQSQVWASNFATEQGPNFMQQGGQWAIRDMHLTARPLLAAVRCGVAFETLRTVSHAHSHVQLIAS
jgi:hypothetical protein